MSPRPPSALRRFPTAFGTFLVFLLAADVKAPRHAIDLPRGEARSTLRQLAEQTQREIMFEVSQVQGIITNPVKGDLTDREALDERPANTGLVAAQETKTGAFAIRRETDAERKNVNRAIADSRAPISRPSAASTSPTRSAFDFAG